VITFCDTLNPLHCEFCRKLNAKQKILIYVSESTEMYLLSAI